MNIFLQLIAACFGTISFAVIFEVPKKYYFSVGIIGAIGWGVYLAVKYTFHTPVIANFTASFVLIYLSREMAYKLKAPVTIFLLCGIFSLAPGLGLYNFTYAFFNNVDSNIGGLSEIVLKSAIAISSGIALGYQLPASCFYYYRKLHKK